MKNIKYIFAVVLSAAMLFANAQEAAKVKDYSAYLPKSGDLGITINAVPILTYVGQLANGATANSLNEFGGQPLHNKTVRDLGMLDDDLLSISMKYLVTDKFATRINLGFNYMYFNERAYSINDAALAIDPFSQEKVIDSRKSNHANISLFLGGEYRLGKGRVQGIFGGGLSYVALIDNYSYSWGNAITDINQKPSSAFTPATELPDRTGVINPRLLKNNVMSGHYFGVTGFIGVEWFVAPKISLGGEVNLSIYGGVGGKQDQLIEGYSTITGKRTEWTEIIRPNSKGFFLGTGNFGANVSVNFYITR